MADDLAKTLIEMFVVSTPPIDLATTLRTDDSIKLALNNFYLVLKRAVSPPALDSLSDEQIRSVASLSLAIASTTKSLSVEQAEPIVIAVVQLSVEFAVCCLERSVFRNDNLDVQTIALQLLEVSLTNGSHRILDVVHYRSDIAIVDLLVMVAGDGGIDLDSHVKCSPQGNGCPWAEKSVDRLLVTLAFDCTRSDGQASQMGGTTLIMDLNQLVALYQHWAVAHVGCIQRLSFVCKELFGVSHIFDDKAAAAVSQKRLSSSLRIMKLLGNLAKEVSFVDHDLSMLQAFAQCADALPKLFRCEIEFVGSNTTVEGGIESTIVSLLEEFLQLVRVVFSNSGIFCNIQACIVASILDNLDCNIWSYNRSTASLKPPLAYFPRCVIFILKLIQELSSQTYHTFHSEEFHTELDSKVKSSPETPSCLVRSERVPLLKKFKVEELLKLLFPSSSQWVDNMLRLLWFLHSEGVKLKPKVERLNSNNARSSFTSEVENTACHEEEALFGDLFSESGRSVGSADGYDQSIAAINSSSSYCNLPTQSATELLSFLKSYVFSPQWLPSVFDDGCKKLSQKHIDILLSILNFQGSSPEERASDSCLAFHEEKKTERIHELCYEVLHNILTVRALPDTLEDYLVEQILDFGSGSFIYNDQTLCLLVHTLFCRVGSAGSQLRKKLYEGVIGFISEKAKSICHKCLSLKEFLASLPAPFHMEILLLAFHLSSDEEKVSLADLIFSSLKAMDAPAMEFNSTQLSCWALLVSRHILLLRHMILYPRTCPPLLLTNVQHKLREAPLSFSRLPNNLNDSLSSWASVVVKNLMGSWMGEDPVISGLINQLIDVAAFPASLYKDELAGKCLSLSWNDIVATFSRILGYWKGKKAGKVEDLIIERYIFLLCWDMPVPVPTQDNLYPQLRDPQTLNLQCMLQFMNFSHTLQGKLENVSTGDEFHDVVLCIIRHLHSSPLPPHAEKLSWDFLRDGLWMSLVLSICGAGIWGYCMKTEVPGVVPFWMGYASKDQKFLASVEGLISRTIEAQQLPTLLDMFSSLIVKYLKAYQIAFISTLCNSEDDGSMSKTLLLLKHSEFDSCVKDDILAGNSASSSRLESVLELMSKVDVVVDKKSSGALAKLFSECMLHGFPSCLQMSSGILLSCILNIRGLIYVLDGLIRIIHAKEDFCIDTQTVRQILASVWTIKFDKIFQSIHGKCEAIFHSLCMGYDGPDYASLFVMKDLEGILKDINVRGESDSGVYEWIISRAIGTMDGFRKDPQNTVFRFYLGADDVSEHVKKLYDPQRGDLLVLLSSLDNCCSDSANVKVLNFFFDLLSGGSCPYLMDKIQDKYLSMDMLFLSKWLEKRLLGLIVESSDGSNCSKASSQSLRESTMNFVMCLVASPDLKSRKLHNHLFEAALDSLDIAFLASDTHTVKSYFQFVIKLSGGKEAAMKLLLTKSVSLMKKLADDERLLSGLKLLLSFLCVLLSDCASAKAAPSTFPGKSMARHSFGADHKASTPAGSRKDSETLVLSADQDGCSASIECDATSVDDDEDDGTSDGEVASVDKDEDEDANSERVLASKVCTFTSSGRNFMEQHWYFCYTCDLTVSKGCCSVCAKVCHRGHRVVYSRLSRFFCDCGNGGSCQCLKPRKITGGSSGPVRPLGSYQSILPFPDGDQLPDSDSDLEEEFSSDVDNPLRLSFPRELQCRMALILEELDVEGQVLELCSSLLPSITRKRDPSLLKEQTIILGEDKVLSYGVDLLQLKKAYKSGSLDLKIKADYANSKELKSHLSSGSLVKSLLSVSVRGRLAVGEGDKVAIFDVGQLIGQATTALVTADKTNVKPLSKNVVRFEIVHLVFNPMVDNYLAVAGYEECHVLTVNARGEVTDRLAIELALQGAYVRRVDWVPGSQVQLMVVTNMFVKIYDLSQDNISPMHYFTLPDDMIVDAALIISYGKMFLIVLSDNGSLFKLEFSVESRVEAKPMKEIVRFQDNRTHAKASSLYFSSTFRLLFLTYQDGTTLIGRLSPDAASLTEISSVHEEQDGKLRPAALNRWKELQVGSGLFACFSSLKSNATITLSMRARELYAQNMRHSGGSNSPVVGITSYKALSKDKIHCLVLHEDGSLQIYLHVPVGGDVGASAISEKVKKLGSGILKSKSYATVKPEFPLDFFEKTVCITPDVKLGGDAVRNGDSEGAKQNLTSEDGYLESPSPSGFKISVFNSNPDIVMVGLRVHVGNASANHIPSEITIFQRVLKLDEGIRSWYDIPFTVAESLLADEEFTVFVGPTFNHSMLPRIDALEVYGREKDEFGWKEKMDAILDMEARVFGEKSLLAGSGKKRRSLQPASLQEQVISDGLKLLSRFYSLLRAQVCTRPEEIQVELIKPKCKQIIEAVFESDREPLLQAAACRVLKSVFQKKEIYYQVKDTMRLLGVLKSTSVLSLRLGTGEAIGQWIIEEFTSQMRAVSRIALNRRSNLASFLEINGSEVVDGLMQLLWGIWDLEQPDTQTINNIVVSSVELIYCYAECLALHGKETARHSVCPAVEYFKKLLFSTNEAVQISSSLAIASRLLQVPFPKQTMLTADDAAENLVPASVPTASFSGSSQLAGDEDNNTSSVQYCCDGCSTVPIVRRRWHCTVCPDFDLCEACYEVLDADHLPPPHSRDHVMTAIPVEAEPLGGEGNEIHFTTDEANDSGLTPSNADAGMQSSISSIHVLEANESEEFSSPVPDPVSISASKRAVNSLLLSELLEQLKGWTRKTTGTRAIPLMQLFYRLSSAVGGPFIDSSKPECSSLETLIKWFLDELNINTPFASRTRSSFGEVSILVFMFFTLMLRNWHQPGSDTSIFKASGPTETRERSLLQLPSSTLTVTQSSSGQQDKNDFASQLIRACGALRKQAFINYLMDILQQLVQVFKSTTNVESSHGSCPGSGCGALLTVRRDVPSGNFSPFFSDSYAKAHRSDIFADYHRLLLENVFRLVYSLVRPEKHDKAGDKEKVYKISSGKDLKLEGYQDVLCSYINNPNTTFVRRYARRLFLHLCGSKTHYYSVRDSWQFTTEMKKLHKQIDKCGGFQSPASYERSVKIVKSLLTMAEVAAARPRNWQKYCLRHGDILPFLMNGLFSFGEESVTQTLKLLNLAFYFGKDTGYFSQKGEATDAVTSSSKSCVQTLDHKRKKKSDDGTESNLEKSNMDMESAVHIFADKAGDVLRQFIDCFLLEWNASSVRAEAKSVIYGVWHHAKQSFKETILSTILQKVRFLPMYGQNIIEYAELVTWFLGKAPDSGSKQQRFELVDLCITPDVIRDIFATLHSQNDLLANHPNSRIYNTLSSLVEFDGYYLESEPCVACSSPEVPYSRIKLETLKSETKFTDNRIIVKCTGSYTIQSVIMNVHDARKSKSVKVLNLYYNNRPVSDLSELKNNWSLWKRAKSCHLAFNQTELKVEFTIPITACNFMIELDAFYENLQALSLEPLQCPRCSRPVTDRHGICGNCHENAYQCRQCRNINYENLDSFLCNECGYSKYGRFEFNFLAKPSFTFDDMETDEDMKRGLAAIESESENAHRRYQQLLGFKKPLLKIVSSIGENEIDSQQKDNVQQMMVSLPGPSCKINRKIALLGVLYGEKCKAAFDSVSKSVQTLHGLRRVLMNYLHVKNSDNAVAPSRLVVSRSPNNCYGCATTFVTQCLEILHVISKHQVPRKQLVASGILSELFENNIHQGPKSARVQARAVLCAFSEGDINAVTELNNLIQKKVMYCLEHHRSMDIAIATREELLLLSEVCSLSDEYWESRLRVVFQLLFYSIKVGAKHPAISEHIILPCLRIISQACTPPKQDAVEKEQAKGKCGTLQLKDDNNSNVSGSSSNIVSVTKPSESLDNNWDSSNKTTDIQLLSYSEWEKGASYLDFVRRQYKVNQAVKGGYQRPRPQRNDYLVLKYALRWKRRASKAAKSDLSIFELGSWVTELVLSACSPSIRSEMCTLISLLGAQSSTRQFRLLNLLIGLLPATLPASESAAEYFHMLFKLIESEDARLFLTVRGCLATICKLIAQEVGNIESLERSLRIDISQGFILHKLIELLGKFLEVPNIRSRFMRDNLLSEVLEALIVIRGLVVQKTKLISDCNSLLKDLLDSLLLESSENKRQFIRACILGLQTHKEEKKGRTCLFILEQLCNLICPSKPEPVYLLVLNKAHTQEEFIRGSMTRSPYSSAEIGPLMRDVKNKICHQLDLLGLVEDDYGMELLVAGNIISLDLSVGQVYEQVWKKSNSQSSNSLANTTLLSSSSVLSTRDCPPMVVTYRLQGLDGEATEPMIKELEEDREESQDPEVEFAIASAVREYGGLEIIMEMIKRWRDDFKSNQEQLMAVLNLFMHCCKIRENRRALLRLGALGLLLETARCAFSVDAMESAEGILLIVESLTIEANENDNISITQNALTVSSDESGTGEQAKKIVLMFLERLSHPLGLKKSNKQQRNTAMVARILPYLTYGEPAAMEALIQHFNPYLQDWGEFDRMQKQHEDNPKDESIAQQAAKQKFTLENFVRVSESLRTSSCGGRLRDIILEKGITGAAVMHLKESFTVVGQAGFKFSAEWALGLKFPSVPLILSMLRGLSTGHLRTQRFIDESGILPLLHALEGVSGENEIGARAENLLDTLSDKEGTGYGFLGEKICELRHATKDEKRRQALRKREEMLKELKMWSEVASDGGERIVVSQPNLEGFEDVEEEEDGLACMVCREGYKLRPTDLLGVYSFSKRVNLGVGTSGSVRGDCVYTTVSYFNIIHFQCHQEAKRADAALRNPKKEWEGATLRNNESLCNSLFPVRGPSVALSQYIRYVDQHWENLNALGRADGSRLRLLTYDIMLMLARFATGASFSAECRGGGRESNSRFLPFMIQMARHLLDQGSSTQRRSMAKAITTYLTSSTSDARPSTPGTQPSTGAEESVQFMMVNSLLAESYESWLQHRRSFLQRGICHAYLQHAHSHSTVRASPGSEFGSVSRIPTMETVESSALLSITRPMLVYTGLIEQLQRFLKVKRSTNAKAEGSSKGDAGDESIEIWEIVMKERLLDVKEMMGFSKELLSSIDEINSASDLQEAFDILGVLADVLSGGTNNCEEFVRAAIKAGKS